MCSVKSLTAEAAKILLQAFVSCRVNYCNSLPYGVSDSIIRKLQSIQNAAARLITGARQCFHITPLVHQFSFLSGDEFIEYKVVISKMYSGEKKN